MKNDGWLTLQSIGERDWGAFKKPFTFTIEVQNVQELPSLPCQKKRHTVLQKLRQFDVTAIKSPQKRTFVQIERQACLVL